MSTNEELLQRIERLEKVCSFTGCGRKLQARGYCSTHYAHLRRYGEPREIQEIVIMNKDKTCSVDACSNDAKVSGICHKHYQRLRVHGDVSVNKNTGPKERAQNRQCELETCGEEQYSRGYCQPHYRKWLRHGDPLKPPKTFEELFWERVNKDDPTGCWVWTSYTVNGYGRFRERPVHRISWELSFGEIPNDLHVHHSCSNRGCVNPQHLQLLTPQVNIAEMYERNSYMKYINYLESEVNRLRTLAGEHQLPTNNLKGE